MVLLPAVRIPRRLTPWNPWRGLGELPSSLWSLFFASLVNRAGTMVLPFLALYATEGLGAPASGAAAILAVYGGTSLVAAPVAGWLCDRVGPLVVMRVSLVTSGLVLFVFPFVRSLPAVLAATVAYAATSEPFRPASMTALAESVPAGQRKAAFAAIRLAVNLGMSVGPALGGFLAAKSFHWLFVVDGLTSLAAAAVLFARPPHPWASGAPPSADAPSDPGIARAWSRGPLLAFLAAGVPIIVVFFQHVGAMPIDLVRNLGMTTAFYGLLFTVNTALIVFLEVRVNFATAHWTHARSLATGALLVAAGFGALALLRGPWGIAVTVVVWTFGEMILLPSMSNFVAEVSPAARRGEAMGLYTMSFGLAFTFGPGIGTIVLDRLGPTVLWSGCFLVGCAASVLLAATASNAVSGLSSHRKGDDVDGPRASGDRPAPREDRPAR